MPTRKRRGVDLDPATAPRTVAGYADYSTFQIRLLLTNAGAFRNNPAAVKRWHQLPTHDEKVDLVLATLVEWDIQQLVKKRREP